MVKHSIIIPAYNEESALPVVLRQLLKLADDTFEIIVVDDGSKDNSAEVAKSFNVKTIVHTMNMGKGAAMRTGIEVARGEQIIFMDADNTYPTEAIFEIAGLLDEYDMVIGIRTTRSNIHFFNRFGNNMFKKMFKFIYKSKVNDPLSGLYGLKKECLQFMQLTSFGFEIETEITIKAARMDLKVKEIPIQYEERIGETKLDPIRDGFRILKKIVTFMFVFNPNYSFIYPGLFLFLSSLFLFFLLAVTTINIGNIHLDIHSLIFSSMTSIVGFQLMTFGLIAKIYATLYKNIPSDWLVDFIIKRQIWKPVSVIGVLSSLIGIFLILRLFYFWIVSGFHPIMKLNESIVAFFLFIMGIQIIFSTIFLSIFAKDIVNQKSRFHFFRQLNHIQEAEKYN